MSTNSMPTPAGPAAPADQPAAAVPTFTESTARAFVASLDSASREALRWALRDTAGAENEDAVVTIVREVVAGLPDSREVVAVVFGTMEWDNGHFLEQTGTVYYADGNAIDVDFPGLDELFTDLFGAVGAGFAYGVRLSDGLTDEDDYGANILDTLLPASVRTATGAQRVEA